MNTALSATKEDYLEAIYRLQRDGQVARVKDIARVLNVSMPSVSSILRTLREEGLINHERYGLVELTAKGRELAEQIDRRHVTLVGFLTNVLQLEPEQADKEACQLEHGLTPETLRRLMGLIEFVERCPRSGGDWLTHMRGRWEQRDCDHQCAKCVAQIELPPRGPFARHGHGRQGIPLSQCQPGFRGTIVRVSGRGPIRQRLIEMGVTPGTSVEFERVAPLGDPLEIKVRGYHLSLRRDEAASIFVEPEQESYQAV